MQVLLKPLLQYLVYPLAIKLASWIYNSYLINKTQDEVEAEKLARNVLLKQISEAKSDEDRRLLSIALKRFGV